MNGAETARILRVREARQLAPQKIQKCFDFCLIRAFSAAELFVAVRAPAYRAG